MASKKSELGKENLRIMEKVLSKRKKELERTIKKLEDERDRLRKEIRELKEKINERSSNLKRKSPDAIGLGEEFIKQAKCTEEEIPESEQEGLGKLSEDLKAMTRIKRKIKKITENVDKFKEDSQRLSKEAQARETITLQPKETLVDGHEKASITIRNYLGGEYHFTVDEAVVKEGKVFLIEKKDSRGVMPSLSDIKDGLVKMILYSNIDKAEVSSSSVLGSSERELNVVPVLGLTGDEFEHKCHSKQSNKELNKSIEGYKDLYTNRIKNVIKEANENGFEMFLVNSSNKELQSKILKVLV